MKVLNLDKLVKEDRRIFFGGSELIIPGELSVKMTIRLMKNSKDISKDSENMDLLEESIRILFDILKPKNPDLKWEEFDLTTTQYVELSKIISGVEEDEGNL